MSNYLRLGSSDTTRRFNSERSTWARYPLDTQYRARGGDRMAGAAWERLGFDWVLIRNLKDMGYNYPFPVQEQVVEEVAKGKDCMVTTPIGSGKTVAYALSAISLVMGAKEVERRANFGIKSPFVIVCAPTREMARQTFDIFVRLAANTGVGVKLSYGNDGVHSSATRYQGCWEILIATPGRIADVIYRETISLAGTKLIVFDEIDALGRRMFVSSQQNRHYNKLRDQLSSSHVDCSRVYVSATGEGCWTTELENWSAKRFGHNIVEITGAGTAHTRSAISLRIFEVTREMSRINLLEEMLLSGGRRQPKTLVFVEERRTCEHLASHFRAPFLHGNLPQLRREENLDRFRNGYHRLLFCTDVVSRGIQIPNVTKVISVDVPHPADGGFNTIINRLGRCDQNAANEAVIFFDRTKEEDVEIAPFLISYLKENGLRIPQFLWRHNRQLNR